MVNTTQIRSGIEMYIESVLLPMVGGWQKWAVGAAASIALQRIDALIQELAAIPMVKALGVVDGNKVDIDAVYTAIHKQAERGPVVVEIPFMQPIRLDASDVEKIYQYIKEA